MFHAIPRSQFGCGRRLDRRDLPAIIAGGVVAMRSASQEAARVIPPPAADASASQATSEVAVFAGGCFWGVQGVFQHLKGVTGAVSGYAGGAKHTAHYEVIGQGTTGHAESVRVTFDPRQITYGRLLQVFFSVAHDPTQLNRQGPDFGTQYRSAIFPTNADQARVAKAYIDQLNAARAFDKPSSPDRDEPPVLRGGGLSPGFPHPPSDPSLHRRQRPPEDRGAEARVPRPVSGHAGVGRRSRSRSVVRGPRSENLFDRSHHLGEDTALAGCERRRPGWLDRLRRTADHGPRTIVLHDRQRSVTESRVMPTHAFRLAPLVVALSLGVGSARAAAGRPRRKPSRSRRPCSRGCRRIGENR